MSKNTKRKFRLVMSLFFSFVIALSLFCMFFAIGLYLAYGNDKVLMNSLNQSKYYDGLNADINGKIKELATKRSIPDEVLDNVITSEKISIDCNNYITKTLEGQHKNMNTNVIEIKIKEKVTEYLKEQNVNITSILKESIDSIGTEGKEIYKNKIELKFIDYYKKYQKILTNALILVIPITIVLITLSSITLIRIYRSKHKGVRYITFGVIGSIYMNLMANVLFNPIKGMDITPDYYRDFIELFIHKCKVQNYMLMLFQFVILAALLYIVRLLKK